MSFGDPFKFKHESGLNLLHPSRPYARLPKSANSVLHPKRSCTQWPTRVVLAEAMCEDDDKTLFYPDSEDGMHLTIDASEADNTDAASSIEHEPEARKLYCF